MADKLINSQSVSEILEQQDKIAQMQTELNVRIAKEVDNLPNVNYNVLRNDLVDITNTFSIVPVAEQELTTYLANQIKVLEKVGNPANAFTYTAKDTFAQFTLDYSYVARDLVNSGVITMKEVEALYKETYTNILTSPPPNAPKGIKELEEWANVFAKDKTTGKFLTIDNVTYRISENGTRERAEYWYERNARNYITETADERRKQEMANYGYDLVSVSAHADSSDLCAPYQAEILSEFGRTPGYVTMEEAEANGFRHINCRHDISIYDPDNPIDPKELYEDKLLSDKERKELYQKRQQGKYNKRVARRYDDRYKRAKELGQKEKASQYRNKRIAFNKRAKELGV